MENNNMLNVRIEKISLDLESNTIYSTLKKSLLSAQAEKEKNIISR